MTYVGRNFQDKDWLKNKYITCKLSAQQIADRENVSQTVILKWLKLHNIPRRGVNDRVKESPTMKGKNHTRETRIKMSQNHADVSGKNNPNYGKHPSKETRIKMSLAKQGDRAPAWKGGKSFEPYCYKFNNMVKENIRDKFDRKCFICKKSETECKNRLHIHHVDYNKNTLCNGQTWGLLPLCPSCHSKTNHNRWYWFGLLSNYWIANENTNFIGEILYV